MGWSSSPSTFRRLPSASTVYSTPHPMGCSPGGDQVQLLIVMVPSSLTRFHSSDFAIQLLLCCPLLVRLRLRAIRAACQALQAVPEAGGRRRPERGTHYAKGQKGAPTMAHRKKRLRLPKMGINIWDMSGKTPDGRQRDRRSFADAPDGVVHQVHEFLLGMHVELGVDAAHMGVRTVPSESVEFLLDVGRPSALGQVEQDLRTPASTEGRCRQSSCSEASAA